MSFEFRKYAFSFVGCIDATIRQTPEHVQAESLGVTLRNKEKLTTDWIANKITGLNADPTKLYGLARMMKTLDKEKKKYNRTEEEHLEAVHRVVTDRTFLKTEMKLIEMNNVLTASAIQLVVMSSGPLTVAQISRNSMGMLRRLPASLLKDTQQAQEMRKKLGVDRLKAIYAEYIEKPLIFIAPR